MTRGEKLYSLRQRIGLTLQQASGILGINRSTLYRYEQDEFFCRSPEVMRRICRLYQVSPEIFEEKEEPAGKADFLTEREMIERYRRMELRDKLRIQHQFRRISGPLPAAVSQAVSEKTP